MAERAGATASEVRFGDWAVVESAAELKSRKVQESLPQRIAEGDRAAVIVAWAVTAGRRLLERSRSSSRAWWTTSTLRRCVRFKFFVLHGFAFDVKLAERCEAS